MTAAAVSTSAFSTASTYSSVRQVSTSGSVPPSESLSVLSSAGPVGGVEFVETVDHRQHHAAVDELTGHGLVDRTQRRVVLTESEGQPVLHARMGRGVPAVRRQQHRNRIRRCADFEESQEQLHRQGGLARPRTAEDHQPSTRQCQELLGQFVDPVAGPVEDQRAWGDVAAVVGDVVLGECPMHRHRIRVE